MKFQTPHQEFTIQNLYALLWCKLHRSTSSQLGTKLIFRKQKHCPVSNSSASIRLIPSTSRKLCRSDSRFSVSYIFNFVPSWHEVFHPTWDEVVSEYCHFCYLWASCPQGFPTICWEKWIAIHHINNQRQLLPCFHFFVYGKLNFYANCAEVSK